MSRFLFKLYLAHLCISPYGGGCHTSLASGCVSVVLPCFPLFEAIPVSIMQRATGSHSRWRQVGTAPFVCGRGAPHPHHPRVPLDPCARGSHDSLDVWMRRTFISIFSWMGERQRGLQSSLSSRSAFLSNWKIKLRSNLMGEKKKWLALVFFPCTIDSRSGRGLVIFLQWGSLLGGGADTGLI